MTLEESGWWVLPWPIPRVGVEKRSTSLAGEKRVGSDGSVTLGQLQCPQKVLYQGDEKASEREGVKVVREEKEAGEN